MQTTLFLEDDLADALKQRAKLLEVPFKQVVNYTLRRGLARKLPRIGQCFASDRSAADSGQASTP